MSVRVVVTLGVVLVVEVVVVVALALLLVGVVAVGVAMLGVSHGLGVCAVLTEPFPVLQN